MTKRTFMAAVLCLSLRVAGSLVAQEKPVDPVNWTELVALLVDLPGYVASSPDGETVAMGGYRISQAYRFYKKEGVNFTVRVVDGGSNPEAYASYKVLGGLDVDTRKHLTRDVVFEGFPGIEDIDRETRRVTLILLISARFLIAVEGIPLEDSARLNDFVGRFDLKKLAGLGK